MNYIFKYTLTMQGASLQLPKGTKVLKVDEQHEEIVMWVSEPKGGTESEHRIFNVYPTGIEFDPEGLEYLDTVKLRNGDHIFHIFEDCSVPEVILEYEFVKGNVMRDKETNRKVVCSKDFADVDNKYEFVCSRPHEDGDMSYFCGSDYCRCSQ